MNKGRIQEVRERAEKATPGPWFCRQHLGQTHTDYWVEDAGKKLVGGIRTDDQSHLDNIFIAEARQDIPFLLDHISRLEKVLEASEGLAPHELDAVLIAEENDGKKYEYVRIPLRIWSEASQRLRAAVAAARSEK